MAGDFGEVLAYIFLLADNEPLNLIGPKKWRLKIARDKPAPFSDVIHISLPSWPDPHKDDQLICSEVKVKSTNGPSKPISSALSDSKKDRTSRLAKTLTWLYERTLRKDNTDLTLSQIKRFRDTTDYPEYTKTFNAVAVVCSNLVEQELVNDPPVHDPQHNIILIAVPSLKSVYEDTYDAISKAGLNNGVDS